MEITVRDKNFDTISDFTIGDIIVVTVKSRLKLYRIRLISYNLSSTVT